MGPSKMYMIVYILLKLVRFPLKSGGYRLICGVYPQQQTTNSVQIAILYQKYLLPLVSF